MNEQARIFAYYLPQFHPIPENDIWWGAGFTEWTNVGKAKSLFPGHYQPKVPADLGYYDLRVPETRQAQADLAKKYGIDGFIYWHYWFGNGKRLLERPFEDVLNSGKPDFPFALAWANETWKGFAHGLNNERKPLIEQQYGGEKDYIDHFNCILPALKDKRYILIDGKPLFIIFKPLEFADASQFIELWRSLASENGLPGLYFVAISYNDDDFEKLMAMGFDGINIVRFFDFFKHKRSLFHSIKGRMIKFFYGCPNVEYYDDVSKYFVTDTDCIENVFPTILPNWDHSPRTGKKGIIMHGSTPALFKECLEKAKKTISRKDKEHSLIFIKSWNEWGEGNYLEPDLKFGHGYLRAIYEVFGGK